jgi:arabinose-5-phosphate isomerase
MNIKDSQLKELAKDVLQEEANSLLNLKNYIDDDFVKSLNVILNSKGRLIVSGIGKSAIIGQKIVATLNSTGTPSIFMHAADAIHGDLGIIQPDDVVLCISKSGNTPEISLLVPFLKMSGNPLIALVGNVDSFLAKEADFILNCSVEKEACPNNLAPTSSSTAQMAMGDALASCLMELRGFTSTDFAKYHPGGILGKRLYLKVSDLYKNNLMPMVNPDATMSEVILEISGKMLGVTAVVENGKVVGAITDGDLRRMLQKNPDYAHLVAKDVMNQSPKAVPPEMLAVEALETMKKLNITNLFVMNENDDYLGVIHMHDIIKEGIY